MTDTPRINDRFPIQEHLSPPSIGRPVPECAEAVYVFGFVPHARVQVFANVTELLAEATPPFGFAELELRRPARLGDSLTAVQIVNGVTSPHSLHPVIVSALNEGAVRTTKPEVGRQLFECGIVVPVGNLVPGVRVHVSENGAEIGNEPTAGPWHAVLTRPLQAGRKISAQQLACEGTPREIVGPPADPVTVRPAPSPIPAPQPRAASMYPGGDTVVLDGLLVGAGVYIFDHGTLISTGWFANAEANVFPLSAPLTPTSSITATQELCGRTSRPSDPVPPSGQLPAPTVLGPICNGARFVVIRGTVINATVVVMRNGAIVGYGGSGPGDVVLALGGGVSLKAGEVITAFQYMDYTVSPTSDPVVVLDHLKRPAVEIRGGDPFFLAKGRELPIDGPVFPRGRGPGPLIRVQSCCSQDVRVQILDPNNTPVAVLQLTELFPGYGEASWPWTSITGWSVPNEIPVGRYTVVVHTGCGQQEAQVPFYVIFDPAHVGGPPRFSFDDTAVWFGPDTNSLKGLHYFLHQSDWRVFSIAIQAINGRIDSYSAAVAIARAEERLFNYSLFYHTNDVVDLLTNHTDAQCADDACCLTALLRAVGIPAHPVTADAALETGAANWTFDTWIEFLAPHNGSTEWRILHPHEYPNMQPEARATFGSTRSVATKSFNDLIVMANERWVTAQLDDGAQDVTYRRNACNEPNRDIAKAFWIDELCEQGYWAQPHWDCSGARLLSLSPGNGFRFYEQQLRFGGRLAGTLHVINRQEERHFGLLSIELVTHLSRSKGFPEESIGKVATPAVLGNGESLTIPFDLTLPKTLAPDRKLFLWAHLDGHTVALHEVRIPPCLHVAVSAPAQYSLGEYATVRATISNTSGETIQNVVIALQTPYALEVEQNDQRFEELQPYNTREVAWTVRPTASLRSGSQHVSVASANGGSVVVPRPFMIAEPDQPVGALPGFFPESKSEQRQPGACDRGC